MQACTDYVASVADTGWCIGFHTETISPLKLEQRCYERCAKDRDCTMAVHTNQAWPHSNPRSAVMESDHGQGYCFLFSEMRSLQHKRVQQSTASKMTSRTCFVKTKSKRIKCTITQPQLVTQYAGKVDDSVHPGTDTSTSLNCSKSMLLEAVQQQIGSLNHFSASKLKGQHLIFDV